VQEQRALGLRLEAAQCKKRLARIDRVDEEPRLASHLDDEGSLLIDSHDQPITNDVWALYDAFIARVGARPTLIERDGNLPPFAELLAERERAQAALDGSLALAA